MSRRQFVRESKYRHVFGTAAKEVFTGIRVNEGSTDGRVCAVNPKFLAVSTTPQGGGAFLILKITDVGRIDINSPQVRGHKGAVLDLAWNPFNDNIIASGDTNGMVCIWNIPDEGLTEDLEEPLIVFDHHQKKISMMLWHPTADNILLTSAWDNTITVMNLETGSPVSVVSLPDTPYCVNWNYNGSQFIASCKDKKFRIFDARSGEVQKEWAGHEGSKPQMVAFTQYGIISTGFSKLSARQYALWNEKTGEKVLMEDIDQSNGVNQIVYDRDTNIFFLSAKGDAIIRYFEVVENEIFYLSNYSSKPQTAIASMPKWALNVNSCEVMRFYRVEKSMKLFNIVPTAMTVPRKSETFQKDIFPDTPSDEPALSAAEWASGTDKDPILVCLESGFKPKERTVRVGTKINKMAAVAKSQTSKSNASSEGGVSSSELEALKEEIRTLTATVKANEAKIAALEAKIGS